MPAVGYGTAPTLDGKWLLVTMQTANQIAAADMSQMKVVRTVQLGADPVQILVRPGVAYASCTADGKVVLINLENWKVEKMIETAAGADGLAWAERKP